MRRTRWPEEPTEVDDGDDFFAIVGDAEHEATLPGKRDERKRIDDLANAADLERIVHPVDLDSNEVFGHRGPICAPSTQTTLPRATQGR